MYFLLFFYLILEVLEVNGPDIIKVSGQKRIIGRLDRVLCNNYLIDTLCGSCCVSLNHTTSDQSPMLLSLLQVSSSSPSHSGSLTIGWNVRASLILCYKAGMMKVSLAIPSSELFASWRQLKLRLLWKLRCLQISLIPQGSVLIVRGRGC